MELTREQKKVFESTYDREQLQVALVEMLIGISKDWDIRVPELASLLSQPEGTVKGWFINKKMRLNAAVDANTHLILDFIDIFNMIDSFFVRRQDQIDWLNTKSNRFGGKTPFEFMKESPLNMARARELISQLRNP